MCHYYSYLFMNKWSHSHTVFTPVQKTIIVLLSCALFFFDSYGQYSRPRIKHFTTADGLSQSIINDLLIDSNGFAWIATEDGLNRFDGSKFKHFRFNEEDPNSISGNVLNKLALDIHGNLWVGTIGNGLNRYDKDLDKFSRIDLGNDKLTISDIQPFEDGSVWVTTRNNGLFRVQNHRDSLILENYLPEKRLGALLIDDEKNLWIGSFNGEIYKLNLKKESLKIKNPILSVEGYIQAIYKSKSNLYIGSDEGLYIFELENKRIERIDLDGEGVETTKHVVSFLKEDDSSIWIGTGNGLFLFDCSQKKTNNRITYNPDGNGLSANTVYALARTAENKLLVGTLGNLSLIDFSEPYFKSITKDSNGSSLLKDNTVWSILKDGQNLWLGTADGGLNLIRNGRSFYLFEHPKFPKSLKGSAVMSIVKEDAGQRLWLATSRGLVLLNLKGFSTQNPDFKIFKHNPDVSNSISSDHVTHIFIDNKGNVWGTTYGKGVFRLEMSNNEEAIITRYTNDDSSDNSLVNDFA